MKRFIIIFLIVVLVAVPLYFVLNTQRSQDDFYTQLNKFNLILEEQNYTQAKNIYEQSSTTLKANYNISLDAHAHTLVEEANKLESTRESLDLLYSYHEIGFKSDEIDTAILQYERLLQSNYIFLQGMEYLNNDQLQMAVEFFGDVIEYDKNYNLAQKYLAEYQQYILAWNEAKANNIYGRDPQPNSIAYQNNYMYLPYKFNDASAILKINAATYSVLSFPIVSNDNGATISNINIVGDYIFFLLEQNSPYFGDGANNAVYRISTSGKDLVKITDCDYSYLLSYQDVFFAISKAKGIVKVDNYFLEEEVLIAAAAQPMDEQIISMQLKETGIFYTTHFIEDEMNTLYFYEGQTTEEIMQEVNMHYYDYGDEKVIYYDSYGFDEYMYHEEISTGSTNVTWIYAGDIYKYYGLLNGSVIMTFTGDYQQECIRVRDIANDRTTYEAHESEISYVPLGICYDSGVVLLKVGNEIAVSTENMRILQNISLPHLNNSVLAENEENIISSEDYFSQEPQTLISEDKWMYTDESIYINTEKVYLDYVESDIYISNIYTHDYKWLQVAETDINTKPNDVALDIVWAMAGQSYDEQPDFIDQDRGIINTDVYVYNDDGMFFAYRGANVIPADKALSSNIVHVFSQGEIILENYEITQECIQSGGSLSGYSAIGMVDAGHYVAVIAPKPFKLNRGVSLYTIATVLKDERCISAYSFDYGYGPFGIIMDEYIYDGYDEDDIIKKYSQMLYYLAD